MLCYSNTVLYNTANNDFDIYVFTETWLHESIYNSELFDNNLFSCYRCDRREAFWKTGGGVLIACSNSLQDQIIKLDDIIAQFPQIDITGVKIGIGP